MSKRIIPHGLTVWLICAILSACSGPYLPEDDEGREEVALLPSTEIDAETWDTIRRERGLVAGERPASEPDEGEIGTLGQALSAMNGHGMAGDGGRCLTPTWAGGHCWLPEEKSWAISYFDIASSHAEYPSNYAWWKQTIKGVLPFFEGNMDARGWGMSVAGDNFQFSNFKVGCGEADPARPSVPGSTVPQASWPDIVSTQYGELRKFHHVTVVIDCHDLQLNSAFTSLPLWQRVQWLTNIVNHELYHGVGLGHVTGFVCPNATLMNDLASGSCWQTAAQNITSQERGFLEAFVGDGD
jgi:hypothetical protein